MANIYRFVKDTYFGLESYKVYTQSGVSQGDLMQWDAGSRLATNNVLASGSIFLGVAEGAQPLASLGTATVPLTGDRVRIKSNGIHLYTGTAAETYSHLDTIVQNSAVAGAMTISNAASSNRIIGRVHLPDGTQLTGAVQVPINIFGAMNQTSPPTATFKG